MKLKGIMLRRPRPVPASAVVPPSSTADEADDSTVTTGTRLQQWRRKPLKQRFMWALGTILGLSLYGFVLIGVETLGVGGPDLDRSYRAIKEVNHWNKVEFLKEQRRRRRNSSLRGSRTAKRARYQFFDAIVPEIDDDDDDDDNIFSVSQEEPQQEDSVTISRDEQEEISKQQRRKRIKKGTSNFSPAWSMFMTFCLLSNLRRLRRRRRSMRDSSSPGEATAAEDALLVQLLSRINQQRRIRGEGPLSIESLRTLLHDGDFGSNDYDRLWQLQEEQQQTPRRSATADSNDETTTPQQQASNGNSSTTMILQRIPEEPFHEDLANRECSICLESFHPQELVRSIPHCRHCFHARCIERWIQESSSCPICKRELEGLITSG